MTAAPDLRAITIWQPYAAFITSGLKRYETRGWVTSHRGTIAIHAAARRPTPADRELAARYGIADMPLGAIVAVADLVAVVPAEHPPRPEEFELGFYGPDRFAWRLERVRPVTPVPCSGLQRIWRVPERVAQLLAAQGFIPPG